MSTIDVLRTAALRARHPWPATTWQGDGGTAAQLSDGSFAGLRVVPGTRTRFTHALEVPAAVAGTAVVGEPLEVTLDSVFPTRLSADGRALVDDDVPTVALGPALVTAVPALQAGTTTELELDIRVPSQQTDWSWVRMSMTTPSLRARADALDLAHARLLLAHALTVGTDDDLVLTSAAAVVPQDVDQLSPERAAELEHALADVLAPFAERIAALRVHLVGHSHIDMNWLWTWDDTVQVVQRDLRSVAGLMDEFPEMTFVHSQVATYEVVREADPELFRRIRRLVAQGRWEPATMQWVEADSVLPSTESHARHLLEAVRWTTEVLGVAPTTMLAPDTFGHAGGLPQLAASAGARRYYHHRCNPGGGDPWPAYWWEGDDGARLLAISTPSYHGPITASAIAEAATRSLRHGQRVSLVMYGVGDHGGGPARQDLERARHLRSLTGLPELQHSTVAGYADDLLASSPDLRVHRGESATVFEGCYTSHAEIKQANRDSERLLATADTLSATAGTASAQELRVPWQAVLFNQFHDILCGASVSEVYPDALRDHEEAQAAATSVLDRALDAHAAGLAAGVLAVTNPHPWQRTDAVSLPLSSLPAAPADRVVRLVGDDGSSYLGQVEDDVLVFVPTIGPSGTVGFQLEPLADGPAVATVTVEPAHAPLPLRDDLSRGPCGEPPYLRVRAGLLDAYVRRDSGVVVGLRVAGCDDYVAFGMCRGSDYVDTARTDLALGVLQVVDELPHEMSAWHLDEVAREQSLLTGAEVRVVACGPVRAVLQVTHRVRSSTIRLRLSFWADLGRVDTDAELDWQEPGGREVGVPDLKVAFTARLPEVQAWYETPGAATTRPADGQEVPASRWADVSGGGRGMALLNRGRHGYDALGSRLRLTLVRSSYEPDAVAGPGRYATSWSLLPHAGDWREAQVPRHAAGYDAPLLVRIASGVGGATPWRPALDGDTSVLMTAKPAYDGTGAVLRLQETGGRRATVRVTGLPPESPVARVPVTERLAEAIPQHRESDGGLVLSLRPFEVAHLLVASPPASHT